MKKKYIIGLLVLCCVLSAGCQKKTPPFVVLLSYNGSYVGDNSAVGGILSELPGAGAKDGFSLQTGEEPYGITVTYDTTHKTWEEDNSQNVMMYNAASLFALVDNVNDVTFILVGDKNETVHFVRSDIEILLDHEWSYYYKDADTWERELYNQLFLESDT